MNPPYVLVSTKEFMAIIYMYTNYLNFLVCVLSTLEDKTKT